jgi:hypothetical protein
LPSFHVVDWCTVGADNTVGQPHEIFCPANSVDGEQSISKSNDTDRWLLTWVRVGPNSPRSIYAAHITNLGALADGPFQVSPDPLAQDWLPSASSPITNTQRSAITWTRTSNATGYATVMVAAIDGATVLSTTELAALENHPAPSREQANSIVDCDGQHFVVMYMEFDHSLATSIVDKLASDIYLSGDTFALAQGHLFLDSSGIVAFSHSDSIAAQHAVGLSSRRFLAMYSVTDANGFYSVKGAFFRSTTGGVATSYCFGDGTGTACPCGNNGTSGHGCANSVFSSGALLSTTGGAFSTLADTVTLQANSVPANATCLFYQGTATNPGVVFGDGLRCTAGTIVRTW